MNFKIFKVVQTNIKAIPANEKTKIMTLEGEVMVNKGDYIVTGVQGEQYPIEKDKFENKYEEVSFGLYRKKQGFVKAWQLDKDISIILTSGRGVLKGVKGDYIVTSTDTPNIKLQEKHECEYDMWIVNKDIFPELYELT